jgi:hypothetical protein
MHGLLLLIALGAPPQPGQQSQTVEPPLADGVKLFTAPGPAAAKAKPPVTYLRGGVWHQKPMLPAEPTCLVGWSAGAHSALPMACDPANAGKFTKVVLISGIFELNPLVRVAAGGAFAGCTREEGSPLWHVPPAAPNSPAFELYYASRDLPTLKRQSEKLAAKLQACGYKVTLTEVCGATHYTIPCILGYE